MKEKKKKKKNKTPKKKRITRVEIILFVKSWNILWVFIRETVKVDISATRYEKVHTFNFTSSPNQVMFFETFSA